MSSTEWAVGDGHKIDQIAEEYRFMVNLLGPEGALYRLADAYGLRIHTVQSYVAKRGFETSTDRRLRAA